MPLILMHALCSADPGQRDAREHLYYDAARELVEQEEAASAVAAAMADVAASNDVQMQPRVSAWQSLCQLLEPGLTAGVSPLFMIVRMSPVYDGFDFWPHKVPLHTAIRRHLWRFMAGEPGESRVTIDLDIRLEFVGAVGSTVNSDGSVEGEYGGDTGVSHMNSRG